MAEHKCPKGGWHLRRSELQDGVIVWRCVKCYDVLGTDAYGVELDAREAERQTAT